MEIWKRDGSFQVAMLIFVSISMATFTVAFGEFLRAFALLDKDKYLLSQISELSDISGQVISAFILPLIFTKLRERACLMLASTCSLPSILFPILINYNIGSFQTQFITVCAINLLIGVIPTTYIIVSLSFYAYFVPSLKRKQYLVYQQLATYTPVLISSLIVMLLLLNLEDLQVFSIIDWLYALPVLAIPVLAFIIPTDSDYIDSDIVYERYKRSRQYYNLSSIFPLGASLGIIYGFRQLMVHYYYSYYFSSWTHISIYYCVSFLGQIISSGLIYMIYRGKYAIKLIIGATVILLISSGLLFITPYISSEITGKLYIENIVAPISSFC